MRFPEAHVARDREKGMSLVEVLISLALVMFVVYALLSFANAAFLATRRNESKQFAVQKAVSMLEELKSLVEVQASPATMLDTFDDGSSTKPVLTTDASVTDPAAPGSDNVSLGAGNWKYVRQISVSLLPGTTDMDVRLVAVRIYRNRDDNGDGSPDSLAEVAGVIRTAGGDYPPTQVHDIYALAIENVPGWWVYMANLIPFVQSAIQNVQSRNPGLEFRVHWITKLSYGRDMQYRPQINASVDSLQSIDKVYFYPGKMPATEAVSFYYPPGNIGGHILQDSTNRNDYDAATNPYPYALADTYNNGMRYPDELALFNDRVSAGLETDDNPTLRILLERLYQNPERFRNAIFINLHGELFPFPPIRNYSDPAKDPANFTNVRAVTHPERLRYPAASTEVRLRVYSYRMDPDLGGSGNDRDWLGQGHGGGVPINVTLKGIHWTPTSGSGDIVAIKGGTDQDGAPGLDAYAEVWATDTPSSTGMYYQAATSGSDTIISLYNSPVKSPEVLVSGTGTSAIWTGLNAASRLYGLEYLPAPSEDFTGTGTVPTPFVSNLTATHNRDASGLCSSASAECTPNTARWVLRIPAGVLPGGTNGNTMLAVETRVNATNTGTRGNTPPNLSRTYLWRGSDLWMFGDGTAANPPHLPMTERYQILGDPRHNPYADLKMPHEGSARPGEDPLGMGYNRYFDDFENASVNAKGAPYWKGYTYTISGQSFGVKNDATTGNDGWKAAGSFVEIDMPRIYQTLRTVHAKARVVYTTMTGYSYYYCGLGNEIGYDAANNFPNSIPVNSKLLTGTAGSSYEQSILPGGSGQGVKYIRENAAAPYWWGINWLGELYPDSAYSGGTGWEQTGNLPTGTGSGRFVRALRSSIDASLLPRGTSLVNAGRRTGPEGSTSYYWNGASNATFHHIPSNGTGDLQSGGAEIAARYAFPLSDGIPINRPFGLAVDDTGDNPDHFLQRPYDPVFTAAYLSQFYDHSIENTAEGSALLSLRNPNNDVQFVVVNGISMTGQSGSSFIANWSLLTLIQGFLAAGRYNPASYANHVEQLPRVTITAPNATTSLIDPASITIGWKREWLRWDGQSYATSYPSGYAETSALSYSLMYSADNGATWKYMQDGSLAAPGVRTANTALLISTNAATPTYNWTTPRTSFPQGSYLIRVEAYRDAVPLHYAYHQYRAFIRRP